MQIEIKPIPIKSISNAIPRKAPSPPGSNQAKSTRSMTRTMSQDTLHQNEKESYKAGFDMLKLEDHYDIPQIPSSKYPIPSGTSTDESSLHSSFEVDALRSKVELLELKLEEMTLKVHVRFPCFYLG